LILKFFADKKKIVTPFIRAMALIKYSGAALNLSRDNNKINNCDPFVFIPDYLVLYLIPLPFTR